MAQFKFGFVPFPSDPLTAAKIEEFAKVGLTNFAVADFLAPKTMKNTARTFCIVIQYYR